MSDRLLVVGASLAGLRAAEALRTEGFDGALTILGAEPHRPYDRPPLSKGVLTGDVDPTDLSLRTAPGLDAEWVLGEAATALDLSRRTVTTAARRALGFDGLVIATGSAPVRLPVLDPSVDGVFELRTLEDAQALRAALGAGPRVAIVGGGFIGVEVASTARTLGLQTTIVSLDPPLGRAGPLISSIVTEQLRDHGVAVHAGRTVAAVRGESGVTALVLDDGTDVAADVVVSAVGARPATGWLAGSGLRIDDGIACDAGCAALGAHRVVAAGDVVRFPHPLARGQTLRVEHWTNAVDQARAAARTLVGAPGAAPATPSIPSFWSDHFGTRVQSVGLPHVADQVDVVEGSVADRRFAAVAYRDGEIVGAVSYGLPKALAKLRVQLARRLAPA